MKLTEEEAEKLVADVDSDVNGNVEFHEFYVCHCFVSFDYAELNLFYGGYD